MIFHVLNKVDVCIIVCMCVECGKGTWCDVMVWVSLDSAIKRRKEHAKRATTSLKRI